MKAPVHHWQLVAALLLLAAASYSAATPSPRRSFVWQHNGKPPKSSNITQQANIEDVKNVSSHNQMVHKDRDHHDNFFKAFLFLHESKNIAAFIATKALKNSFVRINVEWWAFLIVKRAQPSIFLAGALEHYGFRNNFKNACSHPYFSNDFLCHALQSIYPLAIWTANPAFSNSILTRKKFKIILLIVYNTLRAWD